MTQPAALIEAFRRVRLSLIAAFPELEHDEQALVDTLDGETAAIDFIASLIRKSKEDEAMAAGLADYLGTLKARQERFERRAEKQRQAAFELMEAIEVRKIERAEFTASIANGPKKAVVLDERRIPDRFFKTVKQLDKAALNTALKAGEQVAGAALSNGTETLRVTQR